MLPIVYKNVSLVALVNTDQLLLLIIAVGCTGVAGNLNVGGACSALTI